MSKNYFGIFNSWDCHDEEIQQETREMLAECNDLTEDEVSDDMVTEAIMDCLYDEKANLDIEVNGYIIAFANIGLWDGKHIGYKEIGTNVSEILDHFYGGEECEWFADKYNVRARSSHHDGTNSMVFRYVETEEKRDRICDDIYNGCITDEKQFFKRTKSIRPFVAKTYGWTQFGRQAK